MNSKLVLEITDFETAFYIKPKDKYLFALREINFELYKAQKIAFVGESGSGKTTLANAILQLNPNNVTTYFGNIIFYPQKENCSICLDKYSIVTTEEHYDENTQTTSYDIHTLDEELLNHIRGNHISMIFQDPFTALNPVLRVGEQISEVILNHNLNITKKEVYDKVIELLSKVELPEPHIIYKKYPHQLSGGQIQRVCIAIALANIPEILIADEPTTALDATLKHTILSLLTHLVGSFSTSLILITHDINLVKNYVDYVYILYAGEIIESGLTKQIFYNPLHPYTKLLMSCSVDKTKKGQKLPVIPYELPDLTDQDFIYEKCIFLNRCPQRNNRCETKKPQLYSIKGQKVKCLLYEK